MPISSWLWQFYLHLRTQIRTCSGINLSGDIPRFSTMGLEHNEDVKKEYCMIGSETNLLIPRKQ